LGEDFVGNIVVGSDKLRNTDIALVPLLPYCKSFYDEIVFNRNPLTLELVFHHQEYFFLKPLNRLSKTGQQGCKSRKYKNGCNSNSKCK
jgi:hypothetical protein